MNDSARKFGMGMALVFLGCVSMLLLAQRTKTLPREPSDKLVAPVAFEPPAIVLPEVRLSQAMDRLVDFNYVGVPLDQVVADLRRKTGLKIRLNRKALEASAIPADCPVTYHARGQTLRAGIIQLLGRLNLNYVMQDEVLVITTKEDA